jgi:hypothetical protein
MRFMLNVLSAFLIVAVPLGILALAFLVVDVAAQ